jgi:type II restriction/modification system DNA methylase subunit YeeA
MFERISDYTELLLPDDLLSENSIITDIRNGMSEEDCGQEELIGWLYQFYIADKKDDVFEGLKKNIKITAENIPAATQLFTPRWIVRYMVENTLGKLWLTLKPNSKLRQFMPYYIEAPEGNTPAQLPEGIKGVTDITFLDPCQGSGHVLVYAFDLFTKIYEEEGYNTNEIPALILEHNLFGIDIDERAAQLAAFALTMKARSYFPRFLRKPIQPNVIALENVNEDIIKQAVKLPLAVAGKLVYDYRDLTLYNLTQADNFGSLIQIDPEELKALSIQKGSIWQAQEQKLKEQAEYLSHQYHCIVTNPPYLGSKGMNEQIRKFVDVKFAMTKSDLMACFIERCLELTAPNGLVALINQQSWMFTSSYEKLRPFLIQNFQFNSLLHLGPRTFPEIAGEVVQNVSFVLSKRKPQEDAVFIRLADFENAALKESKTLEAIRNTNSEWLYFFNQNQFKRIPRSPIGYWLSEKLINLFLEENLTTIGNLKRGMTTSNNALFLRFWPEVSNSSIGFNIENSEKAVLSKNRWFPYNKGGWFRKWFGCNEYVVDWENDGERVIAYAKTINTSYTRTIVNVSYYFLPSITWPYISTSNFGVRIIPSGFVYDSGGPSLFNNENNELVAAYLNSKIAKELLKVLAPTLAFQIADIACLPAPNKNILNDKLIKNVRRAIEISELDWNSRETSWDFKQNELVVEKIASLKDSFYLYKEKWITLANELHLIEELINKQFIDFYELNEELSPNISFEEVTILHEEAKVIEGIFFIDPVPVLIQLLSYIICCTFGRYSLDKPGLILANQGETLQDFLKQIPSPSFMPDEDNIIPVLDGEWFNDDIVGRFKVFLKAAFGEEHFEENLKYIEDTIGKDIRKYFVKDFYNDHIKRYKKRPIYWMFSSPKGHFKALIYMHRYTPDLCSKMLTDYLQSYINKLEAAQQNKIAESLREDLPAREKAAATKEADRYSVMIKDCKEYAQTLYAVATKKIAIDLDDGVKVNYQKFKEVVVPIKGLEKDEE